MTTILWIISGGLFIVINIAIVHFITIIKSEKDNMSIMSPLSQVNSFSQEYVVISLNNIKKRFEESEISTANKDIEKIIEIFDGNEIQAEIRVTPDYFDADLVFFTETEEYISEFKLARVGGAWSEFPWLRLYCCNELLDNYYFPYIEEKSNKKIINRNLYKKWLNKDLRYLRENESVGRNYNEYILNLNKKYCEEQNTISYL